jgi:predicted ABC-class ATPase
MSELNERQKYIANIEKELAKAAKAKRFTDSEEGKYVIDYISELISSQVNRFVNKRVSHEEYIELRAQVDILKRLKQVLELQANEQVLEKLHADLELATSED